MGAQLDQSPCAEEMIGLALSAAREGREVLESVLGRVPVPSVRAGAGN